MEKHFYSRMRSCHQILMKRGVFVLYEVPCDFVCNRFVENAGILILQSSLKRNGRKSRLTSS